MKLSTHHQNRLRDFLFLTALAIAAVLPARAQGVVTTTVQGTVYFANGAPGSGTVQLTWPAFTTAAGQAIASGRSVVTIGADGFLTVNLAPNVGATPAGLYYTAVYHLSDGSTSTEYWVVPAAAQVTLGQVRAQLMPAAQAVQAVSKSYVDQSIAQLTQSVVTAGGGTLSGPLFLNGDPSSPTQAATKRYVDNEFAQALPSGGGVVSGPLTAQRFGAIYQADQSAGADFGSKLQSCINGLNSTYGGTCDARNFSGALTMASNLTIAMPNATVYLPCATIATANSIVIPAGTRNVTLHGCASRGTSAASGSQGGTVIQYSGSAPFLEIGDSTYAADTQGFHLDNIAINTTSATSSTAQAIAIWRTQELSLASLYLLGNANQTGITLDGTGNYTGGTIEDVHLTGFQTAINAIGHQIANPAATDWLNASTFVRLHIDCPTSGGNPIAGTTGINLLAGDGNTFTGGDVESCSTAMHLGPNAQNNTIVGLRNENSTSQVVADAGSSYNSWMTGGTMFTAKLTDNGTRNSFLDTFHRSFNGLNGDWYGSQQDATLTNHYRLGIGNGNERGLLNRYQTDYGYRWTTGLSDAASGEQFYQVLDELNSVYRLSIGQYNDGQSSSNNQTVVNSAGTGAVVLNGSANAGTGGVVFGSGGATGATVATVSNAGNAQFNGTLVVGGTSQSTGNMTVRNNADAEVDYYLWPGLTASQKASYTYKDYNGASQWYMLKDANNNWALNSAVGGLDSFKAYQSGNSGDTYINASNATGAVRINYEAGSGAAFNIYGGNSSALYAGFTGPTSIKFPGLAASAGHNCLQIDNAGFLSNSGSGCGTASNVPAAGLAFSDNSVQTTSQQGALTGSANDSTARSAAASAQTAASAAQATAGAALPANGTTSTGSGTGNVVAFPGAVTIGTTTFPASLPVSILAFGCVGDGSTDDSACVNAAVGAAPAGSTITIPAKMFAVGGTITLNAGKRLAGFCATSARSTANCASGFVALPSLAGKSMISVTSNGSEISGLLFNMNSVAANAIELHTDSAYGAHIHDNSFLTASPVSPYTLYDSTHYIFVNGTGPNGLYGLNITRNWFWDGIKDAIYTVNGGDSCNVRDNLFSLTQGGGGAAISWSSIGNASHLVIENNNITGGSQMIYIKNTYEPKIIKNQIEMPFQATGSHQAIITLDTIHNGAQIEMNNINAESNVLDAIALVNSPNVVIRANAISNTAATGTVDTSGTAVTWDSGPKFNMAWGAARFTIAGIDYAIATVNSPTSITLATSAGTQSAVPFSVGQPISVDAQSTRTIWANNINDQPGSDAGSGTILYQPLQAQPSMTQNAIPYVDSARVLDQDSTNFNWNGSFHILTAGSASSVDSIYTGGFRLMNGSTQEARLYYSGGVAMDRVSPSTLFFSQGGVNYNEFDSAGNLVFANSKGQHIITKAANSDISGQCTLTSGLNCAISFTASYANPPVCTANDQTNIAAVRVGAPTPSGGPYTGFTIYAGTGAVTADAMNYICLGNPN